MGDRHDRLRAAVTRDYENVRALFAQLEPGMMSRPATDGWTVGQLSGHMAISPRGLKFVVNRLRRGKDVVVPPGLNFIINVRNWWNTRRFKRPTRDELIRELEAAHEELLAFIDGISEDELDRGGRFLDQGRQTVFENIMRSAEHTSEHAADVRRGAGLGITA